MPASRVEWAKGYLACAKEDLRASEAILKLEDPPLGTLAMLFQMVFEKIGKAILLSKFKHLPEDLRRDHASVKALAMIQRTTDWLQEGGPQRGTVANGSELPEIIGASSTIYREKSQPGRFA